MQQASGWCGLFFSMAKRQLSLISRLSPRAFQFADTLGTTFFFNSKKDGFWPSMLVSSAGEEKAEMDPELHKGRLKPLTLACSLIFLGIKYVHEDLEEDKVSVHFKVAVVRAG